MVVGMEAGEPPDRRDIVQQERVLIAAEEDAVVGVEVPLVCEVKPTALFCRSTVSR